MATLNGGNIIALPSSDVDELTGRRVLPRRPDQPTQKSPWYCYFEIRNGRLLHFHAEEALWRAAHVVGHGNHASGSRQKTAHRGPSGGGEVGNTLELVILPCERGPTDDALSGSIHRDTGTAQLQGLGYDQRPTDIVHGVVDGGRAAGRDRIRTGCAANRSRGAQRGCGRQHTGIFAVDEA